MCYLTAAVSLTSTVSRLSPAVCRLDDEVEEISEITEDDLVEPTTTTTTTTTTAPYFPVQRQIWGAATIE